LAALAEQGVPFTLALAGQNQRHDRADFAWVQERLGERIVHAGYVPDAEYRQLLVGADVVVSAADHEFFGIALVEAIAAGAVPVLPDRLSFPELIEPRWHRHVLYPEGELRTRLDAVLADLDAARRSIGGLRESMMRFDWSVAAAAHDQAVDDVAVPK
jgi:glycosyltransferase involved in cell wall biosynthesis